MRLTYEQIEAAGIVEAGRNPGDRMVTVRALHDRVMDNGHTYTTGDVFHMEIRLVPVHVEAGQVEIVRREAAEVVG